VGLLEKVKAQVPRQNELVRFWVQADVHGQIELPKYVRHALGGVQGVRVQLPQKGRKISTKKFNFFRPFLQFLGWI